MSNEAPQSHDDSANAPVSSAAAAPATPAAVAAVAPTDPPPGRAPAGRRRVLRWGIGLALLVVILAWGVPYAHAALTTASTDDAYVNGKVTLVAPRIVGQVAKVFVDDNNRVHKGDPLMQLDPAPYQAQVNIAQAAVAAATADLAAAEDRARALVGEVRAARFALDRVGEQVRSDVAQLHAQVAALAAQKATLAKAQGDFERVNSAAKSGAVSIEEVESRREALAVAQARVESALQAVYQIRTSLGLPAQPETGDDLTQVPADLDQNITTVRQAQGELMRAAAELGVVTSSYNQSPREMIAEFLRRDPNGDIDKIYRQILQNAPMIQQAGAKLLQARRSLEQAQLYLSYTTITAEIDGVVTSLTVNPGDNVIAGQSILAIRSLTDTWIDANFKETQLADLRIGQPVDIEVDMYGRRQTFQGRVSGFTFGTGSTLALLPAENASGNYVKVVQRLPVRIDLIDYHPDRTPLFTGLSVTPHIHINETPTGPDAGQFLQAYGAPLAPAPAPASAPANVSK